jgi:Molybdopterin oxidoreductase
LEDLYNNKIKNILLIGINLRIQNPLLYIRLKNLNRKNVIKLYNIGLNYNYSLNFSNTRLELKKFIEGRSFINNIFSKSDRNLILINNNLFNEKFSIDHLRFFFNKYLSYNNYKLYALNISIHNIIFNEFNLTNSINNFKDETYQLKKVSMNKDIKYFINTDNLLHNKFDNSFLSIYQGQYTSNIPLVEIKKLDYILPTINSLEKDSIYINFFGYVQKVRFFKEVDKQGARSDLRIIYYLFRFIIKYNFIYDKEEFNVIQSFFKSYNFTINSILKNLYINDSNRIKKCSIINNIFFDINTNIFKSNQVLKLSLNMNKTLKNYNKGYINFN